MPVCVCSRADADFPPETGVLYAHTSALPTPPSSPAGFGYGAYDTRFEIRRLSPGPAAPSGGEGELIGVPAHTLFAVDDAGPDPGPGEDGEGGVGTCEGARADSLPLRPGRAVAAC
jgi:hypothetical protein